MGKVSVSEPSLNAESVRWRSCAVIAKLSAVKLPALQPSEPMKTRLGTHCFQRAGFRRKSFRDQQGLSPCPYAGSDAYSGVSQRTHTTLYSPHVIFSYLKLTRRVLAGLLSTVMTKSISPRPASDRGAWMLS